MLSYIENLSSDLTFFVFNDKGKKKSCSFSGPAALQTNDIRGLLEEEILQDQVNSAEDDLNIILAGYFIIVKGTEKFIDIS